MTGPVIAGFVSRDEAGLRKARSVSHHITPDQGGVALHYGGPAVRIKDHGDCLATWRAWQAFHMDSHGWVDIAYTLGVCQHGFALAGRGAGVRTAAQGTNAGNDDYYAVVWVGGEGQVPSEAAVDAATWAIRELRLHGDAGLRVRPHKSFHATACPGPQLTIVAAALDRRAIPADGPPTADRWLGLHSPMMRDLHGLHDVSNAQHALVVAGLLKPADVDGIYGRKTADATNTLQARYEIPERGWGPLTWAKARELVHG